MSETDSDSSTADVLATFLGYLLGSGSLLLYTPIAIRLIRQRSADGLTLSTWWLKLVGYTFTDVYSFSHGYDLSTYIETLIITVEAAIVLLLVVYFQSDDDNRNGIVKFIASVIFYVVCVTWMVTGGGDDFVVGSDNSTSLLSSSSPRYWIIELGQGASTCFGIGALVPQFIQNAKRQSSGDYSPVTATLAAGGCFVRLFTTIQLNGSDPLLLGGFFLGFVVDMSLLVQILYYGTVVEGQSILAVFSSDFFSSKHNHHNEKQCDQKEVSNDVEINGLVAYGSVPIKEEEENKLEARGTTQ